MAGQVYRFPFEDSKKNRAWIRFKQLDFALDDRNVININGSDTDVAYLYLPGSISAADGISYNEKDLKFTGRLIERAILNGAAGPIDNIGDRAKSTLDFLSGGMVEAIEAGQGFFAGEKVNAALVTKVLQRFNLDNTAAGAGVRSGLRYTANPHTRSIFDQVNIRSFSFPFTFTPTNRQEAEEVEKIIKFFRKIAYPEYENTGDVAGNLVYKFPSMVKVDMFYQISDEAVEILNSNPTVTREIEDQFGVDNINSSSGVVRIGPRMLYSYITDVETTWDPDSTMAWHSDGRPISTSLNISLTEDRTLSKDLIEAGY